MLIQDHTAGSDTIFVQIYMDALPGVQGVSKGVFALELPKKGTNFEKKCQKNLVFLDFFEYSSIWGQY